MRAGKANFIIDAHFGSSGKGKMSAWLAEQFCATDVSASNAPNAGHTCVIGDQRFVAKVLPTPAFLARAARDMNHFGGLRVWLSPESYFSPVRLAQEMRECGQPLTLVHERAGVVTEEHAARERGGQDSTAHVASTMQGSATAMTDKIMRRRDVVLARGANLSPCQVLGQDAFADALALNVRKGMHLHEVSQGWALGINYGLSYPYCTSRQISVSKALDDLSLPPSACGDVYLNLRTFPIRVGNLVVDGEERGHSGPFFPDTEEITWDRVGQDAGMPGEEVAKLRQSELTTVTKRLRRVSTFPWASIGRIARVTGATKLILNFAQYLDWKDHGIRSFHLLSGKTRAFVDKLEAATNLPVCLVGTGADHDDVAATKAL